MIQENHINIDQEVMFDLIKYKLVLLFDHIKKDKNRQTHVDQNQNNDPPCVDLKFIIIYFKFAILIKFPPEKRPAPPFAKIQDQHSQAAN